jgi:hypothetical protein
MQGEARTNEGKIAFCGGAHRRGQPVEAYGGLQLSEELQKDKKNRKNGGGVWKSDSNPSLTKRNLTYTFCVVIEPTEFVESVKSGTLRAHHN